MEAKKSVRDLIAESNVEELFVLLMIGVITFTSLLGIIFMENPPEILTMILSGGAAAFGMRSGIKLK